MTLDGLRRAGSGFNHVSVRGYPGRGSRCRSTYLTAFMSSK
jgi:hypothetical protein